VLRKLDITFEDAANVLAGTELMDTIRKGQFAINSAQMSAVGQFYTLADCSVQHDPAQCLARNNSLGAQQYDRT